MFSISFILFRFFPVSSRPFPHFSAVRTNTFLSEVFLGITNLSVASHYEWSSFNDFNKTVR